MLQVGISLSRRGGSVTTSRLARDLYWTKPGTLAFIIGNGPSVEYAEKFLKEKAHDDIITIAINRAIERVPADYWFWIDLEAYNASKEHPNARAATRIGVDHYAQHYDEEVYVWERILKDFQKGIEEGKLAHRATSFVAATSFAWRLGAFRVVYVGCDNRVSKEFIEARTKADPSHNWGSVYSFTFARINEALAKRDLWMPRKVMLADASKIGIEWGDLPLPKTTIGKELTLLMEFKAYLAEKENGNPVGSQG